MLLHIFFLYGVIELSMTLNCLSVLEVSVTRTFISYTFLSIYLLLTTVFVTETSKIERQFIAMLSSITP